MNHTFFAAWRHSAVLTRIAARLALGWCLAGAPLGMARADEALLRLSWMSGCWAAVGGEVGAGEMWTSTAGASLLGLSRTLRQGRTVAHEFLQIRRDAEGRLVLIAEPSGQARAVFVLLRQEAHEVVFENPTHDFPQRVAYALRGPAQMEGRIEGKRGERERVIRFPFERVACEVFTSIKP
jgi:hypothetical protein